jgi:fucose 4-O-acetylase-like acetyltransferase
MQTSTPASPQRLERPVPARPAARPRVRAAWVDIAKGMGIVLVVAGHAIGGVVSARLVGADSVWNEIFYAIYTFHMALFFGLAGLFVQQRLAADADAFTRDAVVRIAWPYLLWSVVQLLVIDAMGSAVNRPTPFDGQRLVALLWEPTSQFWFLQALFVLHLLARVVVPRAGVLVLLLLLVAARGAVVGWSLPTLLEMPARFGLFYAAGVFAGPALVAGAAAWPWLRGVLAACGLAMAWALAATGARLAGAHYGSLFALPAAVLGSAAVVVLAHLPRARAGAAWAALGRASMAIFLLHVLFVAGTRIALVRLFGIESPGLIVLLAVAAGIAGPLLVRAIALRVGVARATGLA